MGGVKSMFRHPESQGGKKISSPTAGGMGIATQLARWLLLPDPQVLWVPFALPKALWASRKCEVIYSSLSPYSAHLLALIVKKITGKPWVADYRDEWSLNMRWSPPTRFHRWLGRKLDEACIRNADCVINVTPGSSESCAKFFGGPGEKFVTIPNGYDEEDVAPFRDRGISGDRLTFTSIGSLYGGRDITPFLRAIVRGIKNGVLSRDGIYARIIGSCSPSVSLAIEQLGLSDVVESLPRVSQAEAFDELARSHIALLIGSDMEKVAMTTKVYEYAGMGKLIFGIAPDGPVSEFVRRCGGVCIDSKDEQGILEQLVEFTRQLRERTLTTKCDWICTREFKRESLAKRLINQFDCILARRERDDNREAPE
jgi:glycosyltransferase involved in cell wall biosynthesis